MDASSRDEDENERQKEADGRRRQATLASLIGQPPLDHRSQPGKPRAEIELVPKALAALGLELLIGRPGASDPTGDPLEIVDIDAVVRRAKQPPP